MSKKILDKIDELNTFDSYYVSSKVDNSLVLYFINVGVSEHPLNTSKQKKYIDRSYIVCENLHAFNINYNFINVKGVDNLQPYYFGGWDLLKGQHTEIELVAERVSLILPDDVQIRFEPFYPIDTPNFKQNMSTEALIKFFEEKISV